MNSSKTFIAILVSFQCLFLFSFAEIPVSLNSSGQFQLPSSDIVEFIIDNSSSQKVVQFDLSIDIDNSHNLSSAHFLLLICGSRIRPTKFISDIALFKESFLDYQQYYDIFMIDIDGLSSGSKKLSVFYSKTIANKNFDQIFVYALGPYKFGEEKPTYTGYRTESYLSSYSVTTQRTCQGNCNGHGDCIGYAQNLSYCKCQSGFISSDCSVPAQILVLDTKSNQYSGIVNLKPGDKLYLQIDFSDIRNQKVVEFFLNIKASNSMMMFSAYAKKQESKFLTPDYKQWINKLGYDTALSIDQDTTWFFLSTYKVKEFIDGEGSLVTLFTEVTESTQISFGLSINRNEGKTDNRNNNTSNNKNNNNNDKDISNGRFSTGKLLAIIFSLTFGLQILIWGFVFLRRYLKKLRLIKEQQNLGQLPNEQERQDSQESLRRNSNDNNIGLPPIHTHRYLINKLMPAQTYQPNLLNYNQEQNQINENGIECSICTEQFSPIYGKVRKTICNHIFHDDCLIQWLKRNHSCPLCRRSLTTASLVSFQANPHSYQNIAFIGVFPYSN